MRYRHLASKAWGQRRMALSQSQTHRLVLVRYLLQIGIEQSHKSLTQKLLALTIAA
jgi:hypothetical protein